MRLAANFRRLIPLTQRIDHGFQFAGVEPHTTLAVHLPQVGEKRHATLVELFAGLFAKGAQQFTDGFLPLFARFDFLQPHCLILLVAAGGPERPTDRAP